MKNIIHKVFLPVVCLLALSVTALAQSSVEKADTSQQAREPETALERAKAATTKPGETKPKPETGREWGVYSTTTSLELGYRFVNTKGDERRYLSEVNVRDGLRLLNYSLDMRSRPGTGILFDFFKFEANNAGGDQSQTFTLRVDKTRAYRFDANVRRFNYYRALTGFASPLPNTTWRESDLRQQVSDFRLKLFPQRAVRVNLGYGRSSAKGRFTPTYSYEGDLFQLLGDTRWEANDYSLGLDATYRKWAFFAEQLYRGFRNDPQIGAKPNDPGANLPPAPTTALAFFERDTPLRSRAAVTRASVAGTIGERIQVVLRGLHDDERMRTPYYEISNGTGRNNARIITRVLTADGTVRRPNSVVDAAISVDLNKHFTLNETFRYSGFRILGDTNTLLNNVQQTGTAAPTTVITTTVGSRVTDYTSYWNTVSLQASYGKKFAANAGWRVLQRDITLNGLYTSRASNSVNVTNLVNDETESIATHAFVGGFRVRPTNRMSFMFDTEHGTSNNAFIRISPLEYTRFRIRTQIQATDKLAFTGVITTTDRLNPTPQVNNESDMRSYTAAVDWEPHNRAWLNVGYDYHHLFSTADIRYFLAGNTLKTGRSLYYARLNTVFTNARFGLTKQLDLLLAYYYLMDRGAPPVSVGADDLVTALPLHRHNPEVRLAYRFNHIITGNLSYRHYSYNERQFAVQDYRSNILTSSLRFTF